MGHGSAVVDLVLKEPVGADSWSPTHFEKYSKWMGHGSAVVDLVLKEPVGVDSWSPTHFEKYSK